MRSYLPALPHDAVDQRGHVDRLGLPQVADQGPRRMGVRAEHGHRRPRQVGGRAGRERLEVRLGAAAVVRRRADDELVEHVVDPVDDRRGRAEVAGERDRLRVHEAGGAEEQVDVCPPEAVQRLLGIADEEELARARCPVVARLGRHGDGPDDVELQRIGVLVLVQQERLVALRQLPADARTVLGVAHDRAAEDQQVVEGQPSRAAAGPGLLEREAGQLVAQAGEDRLDQGVDHRAEGTALEADVE